MQSPLSARVCLVYALGTMRGLKSTVRMGRSEAGRHRPSRGRKGFFTELRQNGTLYLMAVPALLYFFLFKYAPMYGMLLAFKNYKLTKGIWGSDWVGLKNFEFFFRSGVAVFTVFNTIYINVLIIVVGTVTQLLLALLLNEVGRTLPKRVIQSVYFFPYFVSWIIVSSLIYTFFKSEGGFINTVRETVGLERISFYSQPQYWRGILVLANTWKWVGYGVVIYLATIAGVDPNLYESADLDGANRVQKMAHITWPHVVPVVVLLTLLKVGQIFYGNFGMIYAIVKDNGLLLRTTEVIDTYVFRAMRVTGNFSMSTAMGLLQSVAGMLMILGVNGLVRKANSEWAIF